MYLLKASPTQGWCLRLQEMQSYKLGVAHICQDLLLSSRLNFGGYRDILGDIYSAGNGSFSDNQSSLNSWPWAIRFI